MNRDALKTVVGLVIIVGIVVATFWYGNFQRKSQLKHDAAVRQQQTQATASTVPSASAAPSAGPTATDTPKVATNTAPVQSPQASSIQGSGATGGGSQASATPQTGGSNAPLPQTGPPVGGVTGVLGAAAMMVMILAVRRSRRAVETAARR